MTKTELWQQISQLNADLLKTASSGNWQRFKSLEAKRQSMIRAWLEQYPADADFFQCLHEVVRTDRQIIRLRLTASANALGAVKDQLQYQLATKVS